VKRRISPSGRPHQLLNPQRPWRAAARPGFSSPAHNSPGLRRSSRSCIPRFSSQRAHRRAIIKVSAAITISPIPNHRVPAPPLERSRGDAQTSARFVFTARIQQLWQTSQRIVCRNQPSQTAFLPFPVLPKPGFMPSFQSPVAPSVAGPWLPTARTFGLMHARNAQTASRRVSETRGWK